MILKINGVELPGVVQAVSSNKAPWWDLYGQLDIAGDNIKDQAADFFTDVILGFLEALVDITVQLSYSVALIGGAILLVLGVTTDTKRFKRWFGIVMIANFLIQFIFG